MNTDSSKYIFILISKFYGFFRCFNISARYDNIIHISLFSSFKNKYDGMYEMKDLRNGFVLPAYGSLAAGALPGVESVDMWCGLRIYCEISGSRNVGTAVWEIGRLTRRVQPGIECEGSLILRPTY